jgi:acyl carrier protein
MPADPLHQLFAEALNLPPGEVNEQLTYRSVPQWDSISHMALIAALESKYNVLLETEDVLELSSPGKAREILRKYQVNA